MNSLTKYKQLSACILYMVKYATFTKKIDAEAILEMSNYPKLHHLCSMLSRENIMYRVFTKVFKNCKTSLTVLLVHLDFSPPPLYHDDGCICRLHRSIRVNYFLNYFISQPQYNFKMFLTPARFCLNIMFWLIHFYCYIESILDHLLWISLYTY